jgi:Predicted metalloprotease
MRWQRSRRSTNVADYRGRRMGGAKIGIGGALAALVLSYCLGIDPRLMLGLVESVPTGASPPATTGVPQDEQGQFMSAVLGETEDVWDAIFREHGAQYTPAQLVLFTDYASSACGSASAAVGPFYCPGDQRIYIDLSFYEQLAAQLDAPGDFAQAYVLAHEVGHHVQNLMGIASQVRAAQQRASQVEANQLQVRMELQADCFAGLWAHHAHEREAYLEEGDIEEGLRAASAVGDDLLQKRAQGYVVPESFTHGTAEQRASWFRRGLETGSLEACDTFAD